MNKRFVLVILTAGLALSLGLQAQGWQTFSFNEVNRDIPDGSVSGTSDTRSVSASGNQIEDVEVTLTLGGDRAFNGDLYAHLQHEDGFAVLLNRPGRTAGNTFGYADNGFDVTFSDGAPNGDIHNYSLTLFGNVNTPVDPAYQLPLTGLWAPDGRYVLPGSSYDTTPRTATLSSFNGLDPNGSWTLFLADTSQGGTATLKGWSISVKAIPEPGVYTLLLLGMAAFVLPRFRRRDLH